MKRITRLFGWALLPGVLACGCETANNTERGAVTGGVLGTVGGAIIGSAAHAPGVGALIGGTTGLVAGGLIGHAEDKKEARDLAYRRTVLRLEDIAYMAQSHVSDGVIINQIRSTGAIYNLTPEQITWLKAQGVSDPVIAEMQATTAAPYPRRVYTTAPVVVVEPPPPPPPVGVGIAIRGRF